MEPKDTFLLEQIVEYCDKTAKTIEKHDGDYQKFVDDADFQELCAFRAIQIGELVKSLSDKLKNQHPEMPWYAIVGFRNVLTHDYGSIDTERMWATITEDLPMLGKFCADLIN